ncbi:hypothetical protein OG887_43470 (plasmid) [Streptomyces sp. NBC_00053]|uniref:hypothetical protein n=1 Tax=unclassified Streptomyces TaxID=2593676 RepID=UPI00224F3751|nr:MULTISPECIES: hypothetical protein [unclassified Streptomyces]MCX4399490.1 hypothetical protein [Streptomyces sp. NBC_01767]MCX5106807.1 hypothetical protein [Streptomyces sp. NBC_00439]MCX5506167.1 hypothetical protein [Streptomyces sp. NBC_00052]MCX5554130.1 hypothetical protein [Streptomyces sp. NBC_00051]
MPAPDAGPETWSRAAVEAMDAQAIRTAMGGGPLSGWQAADRLAEALGTPTPPGATILVELVKAGLLVTLSADPEQLLFHPGRIDALAARPDLDRLLAEAAPLGPDQAAARLVVRRTDWNHLVRLDWIGPADQEVKVKFGAAQSGTHRIPLYRTDRIDRVPADHPEADWPALRALRKGQRSPLAKLTSGE